MRDLQKPISGKQCIDPRSYKRKLYKRPQPFSATSSRPFADSSDLVTLSHAPVARSFPSFDFGSLEPTMDRIQTLRNAYDFIVAFLEGMVESTMALQKKNRELLRCEVQENEENQPS